VIIFPRTISLVVILPPSISVVVAIFFFMPVPIFLEMGLSRPSMQLSFQCCYTILVSTGRWRLWIILNNRF
jgi:hypothetical protein